MVSGRIGKGSWKVSVRWFVVMAMLAVGLAACTSSPPDEGFMNTSVGVIYSNNVPNIVQGVTLKDFIAASKPGSWEKVNDSQWIYRINSEDQLTKQKTEISMQFTRQQIEGNDAVILHRVVADGQEMPGFSKDSLFNQIAFGIKQAKGLTK